jgi:hypothetical protein
MAGLTLTPLNLKFVRILSVLFCCILIWQRWVNDECYERRVWGMGEKLLMTPTPNSIGKVRALSSSGTLPKALQRMSAKLAYKWA